MTTLLGCSSTPTVDEASTQYCDAVTTLQDELGQLKTLVASDATVEEVQTQRDAVRQAFEATTAAGTDLDSAVSDAAASAYATFESSVGSIAGDLPISEAAGEYTTASDALLSEIGTIAEDAGCS
jgi:hypothetical protein